jgi:hypothetical protein
LFLNAPNSPMMSGTPLACAALFSSSNSMLFRSRSSVLSLNG